MTASLEIRGVTVDYDGVRAVDSLDLSVETGSRHVVIGPNGAGKTTLFGTIGGQIKPTSGRIVLFGRDVTHWRPYRRARLGLGRSFQLSQLFPTMSVAENVACALAGFTRMRRVLWRPASHSGDLRTRTNETLEKWNLDRLANTYVYELPYGQRRVLELAMATASGSRLLILDEPTAGLEASEVENVLALLDSLPIDVTVLMIEHDMSVAFRVATKMTVMIGGQILITGEPEAVRNDQRVLDAYLGSRPDDL